MTQNVVEGMVPQQSLPVLEHLEQVRVTSGGDLCLHGGLLLVVNLRVKEGFVVVCHAPTLYHPSYPVKAIQHPAFALLKVDTSSSTLTWRFFMSSVRSSMSEMTF